MKNVSIIEDANNYVFTAHGLIPGGEIFGEIFYFAKNGQGGKIDLNVINGDKQTTQLGFEVKGDGTWRIKKSKQSITKMIFPGKITITLATTNNEFVQNSKDVAS